MKKIFFGTVLLLATTALAAELSNGEQANLNSIKSLVIEQLAQTEQVSLVLQKNSDAFEELSIFSFSEKRELRAKNCADINLMMIVNLPVLLDQIDASHELLSKIEVSDVNGRSFEESLSIYVDKMTLAYESCESVRLSSKMVESAQKNLETAYRTINLSTPTLVRD